MPVSLAGTGREAPAGLGQGVAEGLSTLPHDDEVLHAGRQPLRVRLVIAQGVERVAGVKFDLWVEHVARRDRA